MNKALIVAASVVILMFGTTNPAHAQTPQEILKQDVSALQKNPGDTALREKIIKHLQTMKNPPAIPEEARRHYVKALTLFEDAKQPSDSSDAAEEFRQALLIAPWWGDAYMKMGLALETAQRYDEAIAALKLFMATNPRDEVQRQAQDEIYKIEAKKDKQEKSAKPPAPPEKKQLTDEEFIRSLDGARYSGRIGGDLVWEVEFVIRGGYLSWERSCVVESNNARPIDPPLGSCSPPEGNARRMRIEGRVAKHISDGGFEMNTFTISEDGDSISHTWMGDTYIYYRR